MNINKQTLSNALDSASFPVLAVSLVHLTGDISILSKLPKPRQAVLGETQGFYTDLEKNIIKNLALEEITNFFNDSGHRTPYIPSEDDLNIMMNFVVGDIVAIDYVPMMLQELNIKDEPSEPAVSDCDEHNDMEVLIIGSGMSGILAAIKLAEQGIKFKIYEKNDSVGGTWHENDYPGSRVDIANHFYSYSFEENHLWSEHFSQQPELKEYFNKCFKKFGINKHTHFNTTVKSMFFDEDAKLWTVSSERQGKNIKEEVNLVISCVGQLNQPKIPSIKGIDDFQGSIFHSARWPKEDVITGKKVAVIGSGASAFQIVPAIAKDCEQLTIFQRSPPWMFPNPEYHTKVSEGKQWLLAHLPFYSRWYRFLLFYPGSDQLLNSLIIDKEWDGNGASINAENDAMRQIFTDAILAQITDPSLISKVLPDYPPFGKRMLQDNGAWLQSLHLPHVELLAEELKTISSIGISTSEKELEFDTIIFATGFNAQEFFQPMHVDGGQGSFKKMYGDAPESYLGITFDTLPNFFAMYGPGTNLAHAGSIIFNSECQIQYICSAIKHMITNNYRSIKPKSATVEDYQKRLNDRLDKMVWQHPKVSSWYQNSQGKVVTTSPWRLVEYWNWTNNFNGDDYEF